MPDIYPLLSEYQGKLSCNEDTRFIINHEAFIKQLAQLPDDALEFVDNRALPEYMTFYQSCQRRYLTLKEFEEAKNLSTLKKSPHDNIAGLLSSEFGIKSYQRVQALSEMVDFTNLNTVVMVGCGALPVTLFWLRDQYPKLRLIGLNIDASALLLAQKTIQTLEIWGIELININGCHYDFAIADFVYIANQVNPKITVLEKISITAKATRVVVRDATNIGRLLAPRIADEIPKQYRIVSSGPASKTFLSRDLLLSINQS